MDFWEVLYTIEEQDIVETLSALETYAEKPPIIQNPVAIVDAIIDFSKQDPVGWIFAYNILSQEKTAEEIHQENFSVYDILEIWKFLYSVNRDFALASQLLSEFVGCQIMNLCEDKQVENNFEMAQYLYFGLTEPKYEDEEYIRDLKPIDNKTYLFYKGTCYLIYWKGVK